MSPHVKIQSLTMTARACLTCRFGDLIVATEKPSETSLECRYNPPATHVVNGQIETHWPEVRGDHWCGRHEPVEAAPEARASGL